MPAEEPVSESIVVISGAAPLPAAVVARLPRTADVIAVDGGLDHALAAGLTPRRLVGDLDSVSDAALEWARQHAEIIRYPTDKDHTDTELALALALESYPTSITLAGGGDRLDHTLAAIGALGATSLAVIDRLDAWWDGRHITVLHGPRSASLAAVPGSTMSILAMHGSCRHVTVHGARWQLDRFDLGPLSGTGVSNVVLEPAVEITVEHGVLTVFDVPLPPDEDPDRSIQPPDLEETP